MAISKENQKDLLKFAGLVIGGIAAYKILFTKKKYVDVVAEAVETPAKVIESSIDVTKNTIKNTVKAVENFLSHKDYKKKFKEVKFKISKGRL